MMCSVKTSCQTTRMVPTGLWHCMHQENCKFLTNKTVDEQPLRVNVTTQKKKNNVSSEGSGVVLLLTPARTSGPSKVTASLGSWFERCDTRSRAQVLAQYFRTLDTSLGKERSSSSGRERPNAVLNRIGRVGPSRLNVSKCEADIVNLPRNVRRGLADEPGQTDTIANGAHSRRVAKTSGPRCQHHTRSPITRFSFPAFHVCFSFKKKIISCMKLFFFIFVFFLFFFFCTFPFSIFGFCCDYSHPHFFWFSCVPFLNVLWFWFFFWEFGKLIVFQFSPTSFFFIFHFVFGFCRSNLLTLQKSIFHNKKHNMKQVLGSVLSPFSVSRCLLSPFLVRRGRILYTIFSIHLIGLSQLLSFFLPCWHFFTFFF